MLIAEFAAFLNMQLQLFTDWPNDIVVVIIAEIFNCVILVDR